MTNWQQIAEELREAAGHLRTAETLTPAKWLLVMGLGHTATLILYWAEWAAEQADVVNTEARE